MPSNTIQLQTNVPIEGQIQYVDFQPGRGTWPDGNPKPDQIAIRGTWDGAGEGRVYLHVALDSELQRIGLVGQRGANGNYRLMNANPRVRITKKENGTKRFTEVEILGNGSPQQAQSPPSQPAAQNTRFGSATHEDAKKAFWGSVERTIGECIKLAARVWDGQNATPDVIASTAHTLFIEVGRKDMWRLPPKDALPAAPPKLVSPTQLDLVANLCQQIGHDDNWLTQKLIETFTCQDIHKLPESSASQLIASLQSELASLPTEETVPF